MSSTAKALASTGERVMILFEYTQPLPTKFKSGGSMRKDVIDTETGKVLKSDEGVEFVGGSQYVDVMIPPSEPWHKPRIQTVRKDKLVNVQVRENAFV